MQLLVAEAEPLNALRKVGAGQPLHPEDVGVEAKRCLHVGRMDADVVETGRSHEGTLGVTVTLVQIREWLAMGIDTFVGEAYTTCAVRPGVTERRPYGPRDQALEPHRHRHRVELPRPRTQHGSSHTYPDLRVPDSGRRGTPARRHRCEPRRHHATSWHDGLCHRGDGARESARDRKSVV